MPRQKKRWWPRGGNPIEPPQEIGKVQEMVETFKKHVPPVLLKPIWAVIAGAAVSLAGPHDLKWKSACILAIGVWLIVDVWAHFLPTKNRYKVIGVCLLTNLILIAVIAVMWYWLNDKLTAERADVWQHIDITHYYGLKSGAYPAATSFSVINNSSSAISGFHQLGCFVAFAFPVTGTSFITSMWQSFDRNQQRQLLSSGTDAQMEELIWGHMVEAAEIKPGGDAETDSRCLATIGFKDTQCTDVTVYFWYSLEDQPLIRQTKMFRYVGNNVDDSIVWQQQPVDLSKSPCETTYQEKMRNEGRLVPRE